MNFPYVILTDSCADLPAKIAEEYGINSFPLEIHYENGDIEKNDTVDVKAFFARLRGKEKVTTSAVNMEGFLGFFEPYLKAGKDILYLGFSSGLSATYKASELAAEELCEKYPERKIYTVDTLAASLGQGLLVVHAAMRRAAGDSIEEVYRFVEDNKLHLCHWFTVDDLFFLKRGGRVSAATAVLGTMLSIKPVLHVDNDGHLIKVSTARGRKASIVALLNKMKATVIDPEEHLFYICHGDCLDDATLLSDMIKEAYPNAPVMIDYVGPVIAAHSGPGTLALFYLGKER